MPEKYFCPYCQHNSVIDEKSCEEVYNKLSILDHVGSQKFMQCKHVVCPNVDCGKPYVYVKINYASMSRGVIFSRRVCPTSQAKLLPDYIPSPIVSDYNEACEIVELSPKASATLIRRCLQGMIRDFWGIKERNLASEIDGLKGVIDDETWESIDALRKIGNIGAHMERDINVIIDVDEDEAKLLIELVENLFESWYIERHKRQARNRKIKDIAENKKQQKTLAMQEQ